MGFRATEQRTRKTQTGLSPGYMALQRVGRLEGKHAAICVGNRRGSVRAPPDCVCTDPVESCTGVGVVRKWGGAGLGAEFSTRPLLHRFTFELGDCLIQLK